MSYAIKRKNEKGELLHGQLGLIHSKAKLIASAIRDFEWYERGGSIDNWLEFNRKYAKEIIAHLDKIENDFIVRFEDENN